MKISFGRKIPITQCQIKDIEQDKFVPATFYEVDCKDKEDIFEIASIPGQWNFKSTIVFNMLSKNRCQNIDSFEKKPSFYILQEQEGEILGISQVKKDGKNFSVQFIESKQDNKHKYVGQTMLASLGLHILKKHGDRLTISSPVDNAKQFYIDKCGFKTCYDGNFKMNTKHIQRFIRQTQKKTQAPLMDIRV